MSFEEDAVSPEERLFSPTGPVRMADVARLSGVSKMTVSRVLSGHGVAEQTRRRVQRAIDDLGYVADASAGTLATGRSDFVAALVPSLSSSNFSDTVRGLTVTLEPAGLQLLLGDTMYDPQREESLVRSLLRYQPRCFALTGSVHTPATRTLLARAGVPVVEMWELPETPIDMAVGFSNTQASGEMVRYLAECGYRKIGYIAGASDLDWRGLQRMNGYEQALQALGLGEARTVRFGESPTRMSHGATALDTLLDQWPDTDAIMCISDEVAFGVIMQCHRRGLRVPEDIAVAGFGNFEVASCCAPGITTISVDPVGIGASAGQALLRAMALADAPGTRSLRNTEIDYQVVQRQSTARRN